MTQVTVRTVIKPALREGWLWLLVQWHAFWLIRTAKRLRYLAGRYGKHQAALLELVED